MIETREAYLIAAVEKFVPLFERHKLHLNPVAVSVGFPSKSPLKNLGECWSSEATFNGTRQIFISPTHKTAVEALGTLCHELLHACLPDDAKHGSQFKDGMKELGLEGRVTATSAGPVLLTFIENMVEELGEFPNPTIRPKEKKRSEKAAAKKSFKLFCPKKRNADKGCVLTDKTTGGDYTVTATRKSLALGFPLCPCSTEMEMETEDWELYKLGADRNVGDIKA